MNLRVVSDEKAMDPGAGTDSGDGMDLKAAECAPGPWRSVSEKDVTAVGAYSEVTIISPSMTRTR